MNHQTFYLVKMELYSIKSEIFKIAVLPIAIPILFCFKSVLLKTLAYILCMGAVGIILFATFAGADEKYKTGIMLNTLPIKKGSIVHARCISLYILYILATALFYVTNLAIYMINPLYSLLPLYCIPIALVILGIYSLVQIPCFYLMGLQQSRIISFLILLVPSFIIGFLPYGRIHFDVSLLDNAQFNLCLLIIAALIYFVVYRLSKAIYRKKEF